ncbi:hypothetical protein [Neoroseomonas oryzicola]|uniref:Uncharacterized protein n=1 Tax=Neoroseomonas oryzicola TaxID=535904 RepID=A0A9X9WMH9_9PROT|nr:hypothetical protein [Neoroseomonas oryzicola]MBR0661539.1 hypothetical protein [Neoroseomonas oryzicola]NKE18403.1 hypothetical protein [Neoroseomonas oryzicola]
MNEAVDPVAEATLRLEAAVARLGRAMTARPAPVPAEASAAAPSEGVDPAAVAALAARLDETIARLRGVLGEEV